MKNNNIKKFTLFESRPIPNSEIYTKALLNAKYLLGLSADSLLRNYKLTAGLDTNNAVALKTWESETHQFRGHFMGHYLSSLAKSNIAFSEHDPDIAAELEKRSVYVVDELEKCQISLGKTEKHYGYLAAVPSTQFDDIEKRVFNGTHTVPFYNVHKVFCGLVDTYTLLGNKKALKMACDLADYFLFRMESLSEEVRLAMIDTRWYQGSDNYIFHMEFGGMHDILLRLFEITQNADHLRLAQMFDRKWFRDMLINDDDKLGYYSLHSNTEIPCVTGMATYSRIFENDEYKQGVLNFMNWMKDSHQIATGSVSGRSAYPAPADYGKELFEYPKMTYKHTLNGSGESCCSHNLNDLSHMMFEATGDAVWADEYEKRFVNAVMAQQESENCGYTYNLSVRQGAKKDWTHDNFFCCNGSGVEYHSALTEDFYYHSNDTLYIAQYGASKLKWNEKSLTLIQQTMFPHSGNIGLKFLLVTPEKFKLKLRIPFWAKEQYTIYLNDEIVQYVLCDSFAEIEREWHDNDIIKVDFKFSLRYSTMPDRFDHTAIYFGPLLLVACTEANALFNGTSEELVNSLKMTEKFCEFTTKLSTGNVIYKPLSDVVNEVYNAYTIITKQIEPITIDEVIIGNQESETEHNFKGEKYSFGNQEGRKYVEAEYDGCLEYTLSVNNDKENFLKCYFGMESECRWFDILVKTDNGYEPIATQTLFENNSDGLDYILYPIPTKYTDGKNKLTFMFKSKIFESNKSKVGKLFNKIKMVWYTREN